MSIVKPKIRVPRISRPIGGYSSDTTSIVYDTAIIIEYDRLPTAYGSRIDQHRGFSIGLNNNYDLSWYVGQEQLDRSSDWLDGRLSLPYGTAQEIALPDGSNLSGLLAEYAVNEYRDTIINLRYSYEAVRSLTRENEWLKQNQTKPAKDVEHIVPNTERRLFREDVNSNSEVND